MKLNKLKSIQQDLIANAEQQETAALELGRVSTELHNIDTTIDNLDEEFAKKTGILNKKDMSFLLVATALQCVRWILCPELKSPNIKKDGPSVSKDDRLSSNEENHKGGPYDGKSSGKAYEEEKVNEYLKNNANKADAEREEYRNKLKGQSEYQYRTWLEILLRNVPYDAMYAE